MVTIVRDTAQPYAWHCGSVPLADIANRERLFPTAWIDQTAYTITAEALAYLLPLIQGEPQQHWHQGLPDYPWVEWQAVIPRMA